MPAKPAVGCWKSVPSLPSRSHLPFVVLLFLLGGPTAILRRIRAFIVNPFQGLLSTWSWSHIGIEGYERVLPAPAYRDSPTAVVHETWVFRVVAALPHLRPTVVFRHRCEVHAIELHDVFSLFVGICDETTFKLAPFLTRYSFTANLAQYTICPAVDRSSSSEMVRISSSNSGGNRTVK